jgi:hypothetical protein
MNFPNTPIPPETIAKISQLYPAFDSRPPSRAEIESVLAKDVVKLPPAAADRLEEYLYYKDNRKMRTPIG